eukprot:TRINITY_DN15342_c0_g1_i2.p1 TRINITY_DN15342_c0_g1~~TRINITY_DN15342_c0_g1_i2.p1  ORF type:complete len:241 (+),score=59.05 TRINITY_DN15342_c0_g1_i2:61-783(+)
MDSSSKKAVAVVALLAVSYMVVNSQADSRLRDVNRELRESAEAIRKQKSHLEQYARTVQQAQEPLGGALPGARVDVIDIETFGTQMQEEGKHEAVMFGPESGTHALSLIEHWTMCQQLHINAPNSVYTTQAATERWRGKLLTATVAEYATHSNLDLVWLNIDPEPAHPYHTAMAILRNWVQKTRVGGILVITDVASRPSKPALLEQVRNQLMRELGFPKPIIVIDKGVHVLFWRIVRRYV